MLPSAKCQSALVFCLRKARAAELSVGVYLTQLPSSDHEHQLTRSLSGLKSAFVGLGEAVADAIFTEAAASPSLSLASGKWR